MKYEAIIGLEVHVQVRTVSKMFCGCPHEFGAEPNTNICPVCLGYPGALPVTNKAVVERAVRAGLLTNCQIRKFSKFDRKSYFYPDQAKNYQISQFDLPICVDGFIPISGVGFSGKPFVAKKVGLTRIHLEEDVAKSTHFEAATGLDFNRAGLPLIECVSEPDISNADEAYAYLTELRQIMQYGDIGNCDMEKGQMRCDVNISLKPAGRVEFGTKIEIKNMNSFRAIHRAIDHEIDRQAAILESGGNMIQETRGWNDKKGVTYLMRIKENANDYRYLPEPDLPPLTFTNEEIEEVRAMLPERPTQKRLRYVNELGLTEVAASVLTQKKAVADYFEACVKVGAKPKTAANWIMTELVRELSEAGTAISECQVLPADFSALLKLIEKGTINGTIAKRVLAQMSQSGDVPTKIIEEEGLLQVTDATAIEGFVDQVIADHPAPVLQYKEGKVNVDKFLVGQVMELSRGKANPTLVIKMIKEKLG